MSGKVKHGLSYTPEYRAWQTMRLRCIDPNNPAYPAYGGRGIVVCERWLNDPQAFVDDMGPKPTPSHEIDRIDNDKGYEPSNCRWVTRKENCRNRRTNRILEFRGERAPLVEWCERLGLSVSAIEKRVAAGWSVETALGTPIRAKAPSTRPSRRRRTTVPTERG